MIYPNATLRLDRLHTIVNSRDYDAYYEDPAELPSDYDFMKHGIIRGALHPIKNDAELLEKLADIYTGKVTFCYDLNDEYYKHHPHSGEENYSKGDGFLWQYSGKANYAIKGFVSNKDKAYSLELVQYDEDFNGSCYVIGYWTHDDEGYEFSSVGHRLFKVDEDDLTVIYRAIKVADEWLHENKED